MGGGWGSAASAGGAGSRMGMGDRGLELLPCPFPLLLFAGGFAGGSSGGASAANTCTLNFSELFWYALGK